MGTYVGNTFVKIFESVGELFKNIITTKLQVVIFPLLNFKCSKIIWIVHALDI